MCGVGVCGCVGGSGVGEHTYHRQASPRCEAYTSNTTPTPAIRTSVERNLIIGYQRNITMACLVLTLWRWVRVRRGGDIKTCEEAHHVVLLLSLCCVNHRHVRPVYILNKLGLYVFGVGFDVRSTGATGEQIASIIRVNII